MRVVILQTFEGYPEAPDKPGTMFVAAKKPASDEEAIDVPDEFGTLIVDKGHARAAGGGASAAPTRVAATEEDETHAAQ